MTKSKKTGAAPIATLDEIDDAGQYRVVMAKTVEHKPGLFLLRGHEVLLDGATLKAVSHSVRGYEAV